MNSTPKKAFDLRTWIVLGVIVVAVAVYFRGVRKSVESLLPTIRESRISLLTRLDEAREGAGFHAGDRFLTILADEHRNVDHDGLAFPMPMTGDVTFEDLPVHAGAQLEFAYGVEFVDDNEAEGATFEFSVVAKTRKGGAATELFRGKVTAGAPQSPPQRVDAKAALPSALVGERIDLVFATQCDRKLRELAAMPVFLSPVLASEGVKTRVGELAQRVTVVLRDLLADYDAALEGDDEIKYSATTAGTREHCFAVKTIRAPSGPKDEFLPIVHTELTGSFSTTETEFGHSNGGAWPAIAFGAEDTLVRYDVDVPPDGATLEFLIGQDYRTVGVGDTEFIVTIDGADAFRERLDPGRMPTQVGWQPRTIDLGPWRGKRVKIAFAGRVGQRQTATLELLDLSHPLGAPVPYTLLVNWPRGAFAKPRIVQTKEVGRRAAAKDRPSVVFVCVETWRRDAAGCYGGPDGLTPTLDRLASEGLRVDECVAAAPWTAPSVASIFTGLYPQSHGVVAHRQAFLADGVTTLAERAQQDGVTTVAFTTNEYISARKNFAQGFETFVCAKYANARQVTREFEDWLADNRDLQFFAYLHLFEPHDPCNAPGEDFDRYVEDALKGADSRAALGRITSGIIAGKKPSPDDPDVKLLHQRYLGEVHYFDRQLARIVHALEAAKLPQRVVLVVTGDHGEEFGEHGLIGHGSQVFGESVRVPLVIWGPGFVAAGKVIGGPVENASLCATVLDAMRVPYSREELRPAIDLSGKESGSGLAYSSTSQGILRIEKTDILTRPLHAVRTRDWSLTYSPMGEAGECALLRLFDLATDPLERVNLRASKAEALAHMQDALRRAVLVATHATLGFDALSEFAQVPYVGGAPADLTTDLFPAGECYEPP